MLLLSHLVDSLDQIDIVFHESGIVLSVLLQVARELLSVVKDVRLVGVSLSCMCIILINICLLAESFLLDPGLVQANDTLLKLLIVLNVLDHLKDIVLEPLLLQFLHVELVTTVQVLILQTLLAHF